MAMLGKHESSWYTLGKTLVCIDRVTAICHYLWARSLSVETGSQLPAITSEQGPCLYRHGHSFGNSDLHEQLIPN